MPAHSVSGDYEIRGQVKVTKANGDTYIVPLDAQIVHQDGPDNHEIED